MTLRRYYTDSYTRRFRADVRETGEGWAVLDSTYFYPTSGGQPHDTGRLGGARVLDVAVRESDGAILHRLDGAIPLGPADAEIDWPRRQDHMQQHTGQHILSQAFLRVADAPTIGFHLGVERVSIDLGAERLSEELVAEATAMANEVVSDNLEVRAWFPTEDELQGLGLRKQPEVDGPIRVIGIGDFDFSACGGTHVATTAEVGLIAVLRSERLKRGIRVEFLCGSRARSDYARKHAILRHVATALTCSPEEVGDSLSRMQQALQETKKALAGFQERELDSEAIGLLQQATRRGEIRIVRAAWENRPIEEVKGLVLRLTATPGVIVLFGIAGGRSQLVFGRAENVATDLKPVFDRSLSALGGGRGGGARILQGAAGPAELDRLTAVLAEAETVIPTPA